MTRGGRMTQEPLYLEGHPKRIEQDSQRNNTDAPSSSKKKKKKNDRTLHASSEPITETPENPNDISISDAETQPSNEPETNDNVNNNVHDDAQPSNDNDVRETLLLGSTIKKENHGVGVKTGGSRVGGPELCV